VAKNHQSQRKKQTVLYYPRRKFSRLDGIRFGKPDLDFQKKAGDRFDRSSIQGFEGVIAFEIGFSDATGHFDLWYRDKFSHEETAGRDYFASASRISLWTTGTRMTEAPV
jgi:hypothetical protein